jgi:hypothetical protein
MTCIDQGHVGQQVSEDIPDTSVRSCTDPDATNIIVIVSSPTRHPDRREGSPCEARLITRCPASPVGYFPFAALRVNMTGNMVGKVQPSFAGSTKRICSLRCNRKMDNRMGCSTDFGDTEKPSDLATIGLSAVTTVGLVCVFGVSY